MDQKQKQLKDLTPLEKLSILYRDLFSFALKKGSIEDPNKVALLLAVFKSLDADLKKKK